LKLGESLNQVNRYGVLLSFSPGSREL